MFISEKNSTFALVIQIERHIEILLLSNDCVIVPGFGAFVSHHVDARYDEDGSFVPPIRTLGFNPQLTINDSLLVQSYVETYDMSYPEALRNIEDEVEELKQHLETKGEYMFNNIGLLRMNGEGHLLFEPCEAGILTPAYYGLGAFQMPTLLSATASNEESAENAAHRMAPDQRKPDSEVIYIKMSWLRNAVAVAAALIAFLMISTPVSNSFDKPETHQSSIIPMATSRPNTRAAVSAEQQPETVANVVTENEQAMPAADDAAVTDEQLVIADFSIVMASHVSERNANLFVEQLKAEGYNDARVWVNQNRVRRVVYGSYASEEDAESTLRQLRGESKLFKNSWITEIKP